MLNFLIFVLVICGAALYFMNADERARVFRVLRMALLEVKDAATLQGLACDEFFDALRARTARAIVTPGLVVLGTTMFVIGLFTNNPSIAPAAQGNSLWRLLTIPFVHAGVFDLLVNAYCLLQIGLILERLLGPLAFTTVYFAAGVGAGIVNFFVAPGGASIGASNAVLGMYGVLLVTSAWSFVRRSSLTIPLNVLKRIGPAALVFVLYYLMTTGLWNLAALTALTCGLTGGIIAAKDLNERRAPIRRVAAAMATIVAIAGIGGVTMHYRPQPQVTDVRPEIDRVIAIESHTAGLYDHAVDRFRKGRINAGALAELIEQTIEPELRVVAARLGSLQDVPPEHQPLVTLAEEFLKLRDESWQLRAAALHKSDMPGLRQADSKEQASLAALQRVKASISKATPSPQKGATQAS